MISLFLTSKINSNNNFQKPAMRNSVSWSVKLASFLASLVGIVFIYSPAKAQGGDDRELVKLDRRIKNLIRSIDDIVWADVMIYKLEDEYKSRLIRSMDASDKSDIDYVNDKGKTGSLCGEAMPDLFEALRTAVSRTKDLKNLKKMIADKYGNCDEDDIDETELQDLMSRVQGVINKRKSRPKEFYIVSSRNKSNPRLIAFLGIDVDPLTNKVGIKDVKGALEMYKYLYSNGGPDTGMYNELRSGIAEGSPSLTNQMFLLRDLSQVQIAKRTKVRANSINEEEYPHALISVSEGRPLRKEKKEDEQADSTQKEEDLFGDTGGLFGGGGPSKNKLAGAEVPGTAEYPYELTVGTDVVAGLRMYDLKDKKNPDLQWGVELKNGLDEINLPSIWGGRFTLSAILENVKLGFVLPMVRFGDTTMATSGFGGTPQKIIGGTGFSMSGDFTTPFISNSGMFSFFGTYSFSHSSTDQIRKVFDSTTMMPERGYLIRYASQLFYSFGFFPDEAGSHIFRLKLGGAVYGVDTYERVQDKSPGAAANATKLEKVEDFSKGGISGRLEYMRGGKKIPWGVVLQYLDESIFGNAWIQFIINPQLDLKVEGKISAVVSREAHLWESATIFAPSVSLKYHFNNLGL